MTYTGLELLMEKLKKMIYRKDNPPISNHPLIVSERPQFQLLYDELGSMIQTLFVEKENGLHELDEVKNLKKRFKDATEEAHDIVDQFVSDILLKSKRLPRRSDDFEVTLNLEDIMKSILSIKEEFINILANMKMDQTPKTNLPKSQCAAAAESSSTRRSKTVWHEVIVGLDHDVKVIRDKLVEDQKQLDVVSMVGMGGLGKTTLATKIFNDPFVMYHFHVRAWVTVSQTYEKHNLLIQILESIGLKLVALVDASYSLLCQIMHKKLIGKRYLIVIDDIWSTKAWDDLKVVFPNNNTSSRLLLTSRLKEVAYHARPGGFIHQLRYLTNEESWELLCKKVFQDNDCPEPLLKPGMKIAKNCHGLPLVLVLIAGVLAKEALRKDSWETIAQNVTSYIFSDKNWHMETLALSIEHLPSHLRDCFLYLGGFPEDYMFRPRRLTWLWVAEGFIQNNKDQSPEETAKDYLMELVDRNLLVVHDRKFNNGAIKKFSIHDVLRELCLEIASKDRLYLKIRDRPRGLNPFEVIPCKKPRIFANRSVLIKNDSIIRSYLSFCSYPALSYKIVNLSHSWMLLLVLDLCHTKVDYINGVISLLVHLRYLSIWYNGDFMSSICNLWSLQTLIIRRDSTKLVLPDTISNLVNLRHFKCSSDVLFPRIWKLPNLLTISKVILGNKANNFVSCVPSIKKLKFWVNQGIKYDFRSLTFLETLEICCSVFDKNMRRFQMKGVCFPCSLKKLTLERCRLPWSFMSKIQSLPQLEILILLKHAFVGPRWDAGEEPFQQLKILKLKELGIEQWEASSINFPCLKQLMVKGCNYLEDIPLEIGYVPTLEHIIIRSCLDSVVDSVHKIREEQHAQGNFDLKFTVRRLRYGIPRDWPMLQFPTFIEDFEFEVSINRPTPHNPTTRRLWSINKLYSTSPINRPPVIPAHQDTQSTRTWKGRKPNRNLFKQRL